MRKFVLGGKYFIRDLTNNEVLEVQITQLNDVELSYKILSVEEDVGGLGLKNDIEYYRELGEIEIVSLINEEDVKRLNNQEIFSTKTKTIKGILSREEIEEYTNNDKLDICENTVLISITDPKSKYLNKHTQDSYKEVLNIQFWDIEEEIGNYKPITINEAKEIRDFILRNKESFFYIHCEAGISRSAGVGLAVRLYTEFDGDKYLAATSSNEITSHHRYHPNFVVYDKITQEDF